MSSFFISHIRLAKSKHISSSKTCRSSHMQPYEFRICYYIKEYFMKIRIELNRQLYLQKVHGYKKESYYLRDSVFEAIVLFYFAYSFSKIQTHILKQNLQILTCCSFVRFLTVGQTIKSYVTAAKMDTAQNLLKYSNLSYFEISASLGYSSQSAFTYAFRKFTGITPKKYREKNYEVNNFC